MGCTVWCAILQGHTHKHTPYHITAPALVTLLNVNRPRLSLTFSLPSIRFAFIPLQSHLASLKLCMIRDSARAYSRGGRTPIKTSGSYRASCAGNHWNALYYRALPLWIDVCGVVDEWIPTGKACIPFMLWILSQAWHSFRAFTYCFLRSVWLVLWKTLQHWFEYKSLGTLKWLLFPN